MDLMPAQEDIIRLLRKTGALRDGHFEHSSDIHTDQHLETALGMRFYQNAKLLSVALSRLVRGDVGLRTVLPELSIVAATTSGLAIAYGLAEVLRPRQLYWVEREDAGGPVRFPQFLRPVWGEKVLLVDDVLRSGRSLAEAAALLEGHQAMILGIAVLIQQPDPTAISFGRIPIHSLVTLPAAQYYRAGSCGLCRRGVPLARPPEFRNFKEAAVGAS